MNEKETKIEGKLYKAFGGRMAFPSSKRARFSSWILAFRKFGSHVVRRTAFLAMWLSK